MKGMANQVWAMTKTGANADQIPFRSELQPCLRLDLTPQPASLVASSTDLEPFFITITMSDSELTEAELVEPSDKGRL